MKSHEFIVTRDLYNEIPTESGEYELKLVKKNVRTKWFCKDVAIISSCEQTYNDKGNLKRDYCEIDVEGQGKKIIHMRYDDAKKIIEQTSHHKVGFKR
jgi:hypothetical protein